MTWTGNVARTGELRNVYKLLVGKPEGKRQLGRHRHNWKDNIKMDPREIGQKVVDWMHLAQDRDAVVSSCEYSNELSCSINGRVFLD
jgi:hypothetical protein